VPSPVLPVTGGRFVVQRHRATRLHYDVRLEIDGVLVSWAVPRGPSLDPAARRMAVHVEDHPIEYLDFEGVIPVGQYGAGDVIVWDWGTWAVEPETPDPGAALAAGELKLRMAGSRLRGRFTLVRTGGAGAEGRSGSAGELTGEPWLMIHKRDSEAVPGWDSESFPTSVRTGRTNDEVRDGMAAARVAAAPPAPTPIDLALATAAPMPPRVEPMLATLASRPFRNDDWLFEVKWDGYRLGAAVRDGSVRTLTRGGGDGAAFFPGLLTPASWIAAREAIVDGEVVALDPEGRPDFGRLQELTGVRGAAGLVYEVFDLLYLDGHLLTDLPLEDRKRLLRTVLRDQPRVRYADHVVGEGIAFHRAVAARGLEGVIAKRRRSRYLPGRRSPDWLKIKLRPEQELVVGGWTPGERNAAGLGSLAVGVHEEGRLRYAGKVGSGFTARARADLRARLEKLAQASPPFDPSPPLDARGRWGGDLRGVRWVRPQLVIRAEIAGWSRDEHVRQAAYKGVALDRDPQLVIRERSQATGRLVAEAEATAEAADPPRRKRSGGSGSPVVAAGAAKPAGRAAAPDVVAGSPAGRAGPGSPAPSGHPWSVSPAELAALDQLGSAGRWSVGGEVLALTNLDKVLFPPAPTEPDAASITKRELIGYLARIAPILLPHLAERPLNLHRFPDGAGRPGFWQKDIPATAPPWLVRWRELGTRRRGANEHLVADRAATLCWLGSQAAFEIHAWTSRLHDPSRPTFALIDIDPGTATTWDETLVLARLFRTALEHLGVRAYPKTTGQRGIQVWIPVEPCYDFAETSRWVEELSRAVGATVPDLVSWAWAKDRRGGRARLDYTQNASIKTLVAPYAVRPAPGAPVSAPIDWGELDDPQLRPDRWTIRSMPARVAGVGDLFAAAQTDLQRLPSLG
jgi:bifunctional non-homologous end joining protein LigD